MRNRLLTLCTLFCLHVFCEAQVVFAPCTNGNQATCKCSTAPVLCSIDELNGAVLQMAGFQHASDAPNPLCPGTSGVPNNPSWMAFTAWCENLELRFVLSNCVQRRYNFVWSNGVQVAAYSACGPPNSAYRNIGCMVDSDMYCCSGNNCVPPNNLRLSLNNLTIGEVYYLMVDGCGGARCDVRVEVVGQCGREQIQNWTGPLMGPDTLCPGEEAVAFAVTPPQPNLTYHWYVNGSRQPLDSLSFISLRFDQPGSYEVCADASKPPCVPENASPAPLCKRIEVVDIQPVNPAPFQVCAGDSLFYEGGYYRSGQYQVDLLSRNGCDSVVVLTVEETAPTESDLGVIRLCGDTTFLAGSQVFSESGTYSVTISSLVPPFCDSIVRFEIQKLEVPALSDGRITCRDSVYQPALSFSRPLSEFTLIWLNESGAVLGSGFPFSISVAGVYRLVLQDQLSPCVLETTSFEVVVDTLPPDVALSFPQGEVITCRDSVLTIQATMEDQVQLEWLWDNQRWTGDSIVVTKPGSLTLFSLDTNNGCGDSLVLEISEDTAGPQLQWTGVEELTCLRDSVEWSVTSQDAEPATSWSWEGPSGSGSGSGSGSFWLHEAGEYRWVATDSENGCTAQGSFMLTDRRDPPEVSVVVSDRLTCLLDSVRIDLSFQNGGAAPRWTWETPGGDRLEGSAVRDFYASEEGIYRVTVTNIDNGCTAELEVMVEADRQVPDLSRLVLVQPACAGGWGSVVPSVGNFPEDSLVLRLNGQNVEGAVLDKLSPGSYFFAVTGPNGCRSDTLLLVAEPPEWFIRMDSVLDIRLGDSVLLAPDTDLPDALLQKVLWEPADFLRCPACRETYAYPPADQLYELTVIDSFGCEKQVRVRIRVEAGGVVFVPDAFTPNGDGINDVFTVFSDGQALLIRYMAIFDRWGSQVFEAKELSLDGRSGWDGSIQGKLATQGVFLYRVEVLLRSGKLMVLAGEVQVLSGR
jgi:gliding motility-associated-like protein